MDAPTNTFNDHMGTQSAPPQNYNVHVSPSLAMTPDAYPNTRSAHPAFVLDAANAFPLTYNTHPTVPLDALSDADVTQPMSNRPESPGAHPNPYMPEASHHFHENPHYGSLAQNVGPYSSSGGVSQFHYGLQTQNVGPYPSSGGVFPIPYGSPTQNVGPYPSSGGVFPIPYGSPTQNVGPYPSSEGVFPIPYGSPTQNVGPYSNSGGVLSNPYGLPTQNVDPYASSGDVFPPLAHQGGFPPATCTCLPGLPCQTCQSNSNIFPSQSTSYGYPNTGYQQSLGKGTLRLSQRKARLYGMVL
ncbi:uncharacterized protein JCM15063_003105 [Sporobolomyces koalae]|uniref:uncharacterized protein n=1 Tax=Sporobolomyces koalae TaxID=500713 RepID=UPI00316CDD12